MLTRLRYAVCSSGYKVQLLRIFQQGGGEADLGIIEIKIPVTRREVNESVEEKHSLPWHKVQWKP